MAQWSSIITLGTTTRRPLGAKTLPEVEWVKARLSSVVGGACNNTAAEQKEMLGHYYRAPFFFSPECGELGGGGYNKKGMPPSAHCPTVCVCMSLIPPFPSLLEEGEKDVVVVPVCVCVCPACGRRRRGKEKEKGMGRERVLKRSPPHPREGLFPLPLPPICNWEGRNLLPRRRRRGPRPDREAPFSFSFLSPSHTNADCHFFLSFANIRKKYISP